MAGVAFAVGAIVGANSGGSAANALADAYVKAWARRDYAAMYSDLDPSSRRSVTPAGFARAYERALATATATGTRVTGRPRSVSGDRVAVPVTVATRLFGQLSLDFEVPVAEPEGAEHVRWSQSLTFPGLAAGEELSRRTTLPRRADLLARDGSVLAESGPGPAVASGPGEANRTSPLGETAAAVIGTVGPPPAARLGQLEAEGVPADGLVGLSGLEQALDGRLRGTPGGELLAGSRVLASALPHPAASVRTSVSRSLQQSAVTALGGQYGGVVALQPSTGQVLAVAGIGLDGLQPPGSTFKMVTVTGVLTAGVANPHTVFPYATYATLDGVELHNANGEECGGTLENAFAVSCNSVFAPLGVKVGGARLVQTAEGFGFNRDPGIPGASPARCRKPGRSAANSTSARRRSGRGRCWRPRSRWRSWLRRSPTGAAGRCRRS